MGKSGRRLSTIYDSWFMRHFVNPLKAQINPSEIQKEDPQLYMTLDGCKGLKYGRRGTLGGYFEAVSRGIYSGVKPGLIRIPLRKGFSDVEPDIICSETRQVFEVKATKHGSDCFLKDEQIERYKKFQAYKMDYNFSFLFFRHQFQKIMNHEGDEHELYTTLSNSQAIMTEIPFSLVLALHAYRTDNTNDKTTFRYEGDLKEHATHINSGTFPVIFERPEEFIRHLGKNPAVQSLDLLLQDNYRFQRVMSPLNLVVQSKKQGNGSEKYTVKQFPILQITEIDPVVVKERFYDLFGKDYDFVEPHEVEEQPDDFFRDYDFTKPEETSESEKSLSEPEDETDIPF